MSRVVPIYIDIDSGQAVVKSSASVDGIKIYKVVVNTPSKTWVLEHKQNTLGVIVNVYSGGGEIIPDAVIINSPTQITIEHGVATAGYADVIIFNLDSYVPVSPTPMPSVTPAVTPTMTPAITSTPAI